MNKICKICGNVITGRANKYCSNECFDRSRYERQRTVRYCKHCNKEVPKGKRYYCSDDCKYKHNKNKYRERHPPIKRICKVCGNKFEVFDKRHIYCSKECNHKAGWILVKSDPKQLERKRKSERKNKDYVRPPKKYSSKRVYFKVCPETGELFTARRKATIRSDEGYKIYINRIARERSYGDTRYRKCRICGNEYDFLNEGTQSFCSTKCRSIANKKHKKKSGRISKARRRARLRTLTIESVDPIKVFNRDKWICQLCGCKTPKKLRGTIHNNAPEMDHIIPLSKGGVYVYSNVQCLCRNCNNNKSNSYVGQLVINA